MRPTVKQRGPDFLLQITDKRIRAKHLEQWVSEGHFASVTTLSVMSRTLDDLPAGLGTLPLKSLAITETSLKRLPEWIGKVETLEVLTINSNLELEYVPDLSGLKRLKRLLIAGGKMREFPRGIDRLTALEGELIVSANQIEEIPPSISALGGISHLRLRDNRLRTVPPEIGKLNLQFGLDLSGNPLESLPSELASVPWSISVSSNRQAALEATSADVLSKLRSLSWATY
jgi:Leucine-rich repeat (LRR) protein